MLDQADSYQGLKLLKEVHRVCTLTLRSALEDQIWQMFTAASQLSCSTVNKDHHLAAKLAIFKHFFISVNLKIAEGKSKGMQVAASHDIVY